MKYFIVKTKKVRLFLPNLCLDIKKNIQTSFSHYFERTFLTSFLTFLPCSINSSHFVGVFEAKYVVRLTQGDGYDPDYENIRQK